MPGGLTPSRLNLPTVEASRDGGGRPRDRSKRNLLKLLAELGDGKPSEGTPFSPKLNSLGSMISGVVDFKRSAEIQTRAGGGDGEIELSFSSELAVDRGGYREILSHDPADVDMSRLGAGDHPLLLNHDPNQQVGVVSSAWIGPDRKGRARVRFSDSPMAQSILADVKAGIRRLISVGYKILREIKTEVKDGIETVRFAWQPYEISIVAIPADPGVGVGRASVEPLKTAVCVMETSTFNPKALFKMADALRGRVDGIDDILRRAVEEEWTEDKFRATAIDRLPRDVQPMQRPSQIDLGAKDWSRYSITKAIRCQIDGRMSGLEREVSDQLARDMGTETQGIFIPLQAMTRNFVAGNASLGGAIVPTGHDAFIELLRNRAKVIELGARVMQLPNPIVMPKQLTAGGVNWCGETVAATLSTGTFGGVTLTPHPLTAFQQCSRQLMYTSNPSIDLLIRDDIMNIISLEIDRAALFGSGAGSEPAGIYNTSTVTQVPIATDGSAFTSANALIALTSLETEVAVSNADLGSLGFLCHPRHRSQLRTVERFAGTGIAVWGDNNTLLNYRAEVSNQIATNLTCGSATTITSPVFFGNWNDLVIGQFGPAIEIIVDPYTLSHQGVIRYTCRSFLDLAVRHPESFAILKGVLTG